MQGIIECDRLIAAAVIAREVGLLVALGYSGASKRNYKPFLRYKLGNFCVNLPGKFPSLG